MGKFADALEKAGHEKDGFRPPVNRGVETPRESPKGRDVSQKPARPPAAASGAWDERLFQAVNNDKYVPEVFKVLRSRILHPRDERPAPKTIMVTSVGPKEGKSFVTANLGISLAQGVDQFSLLVDCDLRRPSLASLFGMDGSRGLVNYLRDHADLPGLIRKTPIGKLSVLASGKPPVNPSELLSSARMRDLMEELPKRYEDRIIIFDSPPMHVASESTVLASQVDGVILVVREGGAGKPHIKKLIESLDPYRFIGVVFNAHTINVIERSLMPGYDYYPQAYE